VAKVPLPTTPDEWITAEARYTAAVHAAGAPVPRFLGFVRVDGRTASIYERSYGPSLWECAIASAAAAAAAGRELAALHHRLLHLSPPPTLPRQLDRFACKIRRAAATVASELAGSIADLPTDAGPYRLCHGDLHPANIIVTAAGPIVVDWFDASRGDGTLDIARTSLLLGAIGSDMTLPAHLPGATLPVLERLYSMYRDDILELEGCHPADVDRHRATVLAARLSEGLDGDDMLDAWRLAHPGLASAHA
jgi:aminoglycoside phosphotransferase (APT) family kinase protein